jgi:hypothetical protein
MKAKPIGSAPHQKGSFQSSRGEASTGCSLCTEELPWVVRAKPGGGVIPMLIILQWEKGRELDECQTLNKQLTDIETQLHYLS